MTLSDSNQTNDERVINLKAVRFTTDTLKYAFTSFYKVGVQWWVLTAILYCLEYYSDLKIYNDQSFNTYQVCAFIVYIFINMLMEMPYYFLGFGFYKNTKKGLKNINELLSRFWSYFYSALIVTIIIGSPLFVVLVSIKRDSWLFILLSLVAFVWIVFWMVRLLPYPYIVLDKKVGPIDAFKHSLAITKDNFMPILTFFVASIMLFALFELFPLNLGNFITIPAEALAIIHAYKQLESHYQESGKESI